MVWVRCLFWHGSSAPLLPSVVIANTIKSIFPFWRLHMLGLGLGLTNTYTLGTGVPAFAFLFNGRVVQFDGAYIVFTQEV